MQIVRKALATAKASADKDPEGARAAAVAARSASVTAALEAYVTKLQETNAASRALWAEVGELYPAGASLEAVIARLAASEIGSSPWTEHGGANMAERMRLASEEPCAKLSAIAARIVAVIKERDVLATEAEHYEEKVARLAAESAAAPADRAKKDHLDGNKGKLAAAAGALQAKQASAAAAVAQMDRDLDALLTPFVDKLIKQQLRYHSDSVAFIGICTDLAKGAAAAAPAAAHHHHHQPSPPPPAGSKTPPEPIRVAPVESLPPLDLEPKPPGTPKVLPPAAASKLGAAVMARRSRRDLGAPPALPPKAGATSPASSGPAPPVESTLFRSVGDFKQEREGDLALTKGQLLVIFQRMPNGWWRARVGAELGICPSNFLAEVPLSTVEPVDHMRALYDFVPDEKAELRLTQGDRVGVLVAPSEGDSWLLVQSTDGASVGFVPSNFLGPDKTVRAAGGLAAAAPPPPPPASVKPLNAVAAAAAAASNVGTVANRPPPPPPPGANIAPLAPKHKHASHDAHAPAAPHSRVDTGLPPILKH